jgi:hypothetical protein
MEEEKIFFPITIIKKNELNRELYRVQEYVEYNNKINITLQVNGYTVQDLRDVAKEAIDAMEIAIVKQEREKVNDEEKNINLKEEMADGR